MEIKHFYTSEELTQKFGEDFAKAFFSLIRLAKYISTDKVTIYVNLKENGES